MLYPSGRAERGGVQAASGEDGEDVGGLSSLMQSLKGSHGPVITFVKVPPRQPSAPGRPSRRSRDTIRIQRCAPSHRPESPGALDGAS